jgi:hypothetical protein
MVERLHPASTQLQLLDYEAAGTVTADTPSVHRHRLRLESSRGKHADLRMSRATPRQTTRAGSAPHRNVGTRTPVRVRLLRPFMSA